MSIVHYNGIVLPYAQTSVFRKEPVRDEFSKVDWYVTRYEIQVQCLINANYINLIDPSLTPDSGQIEVNATEIMNAVYTKLMTERRTLAFVVDGVDMIPKPPEGNDGTCDAKNGPLPQRCDIIQLTAETFILIYSITAHYWENNRIETGGGPLVAENLPTNPVMSNKWREMVEIDPFGMTVRRRTGEYIIRSDNTNRLTPDDLRFEMTALAIPQGFMRQSSSYNVTPDGLRMQYTVIDKEWFKLPPAPAYYAQGYYSESTSRGDGMRSAVCEVTLKGGKNGNRPFTQGDLLGVCMAVVGNKIILGSSLITDSPTVAGGVNLTFIQPVILGATAKVNMYENEVSYSMQVILPRTRKKLNSFETFNTNFCFTPLSDGVRKPVTPYPIGGSANLFLQAAAYYDPNLIGVTLDPVTGQLTAGLVPGQAGAESEV